MTSGRPARADPTPRTIPRSRVVTAGRVLCLLGAALGGLGLLGWLAGIDRLVTFGSGLAPMMPNTAVGLVIAGAAGALRRSPTGAERQRAATIAAGILVLAIGAVTLAEYVFAVDLGLDRALVRAEVGPIPGRMSPPSAFALVCLGAVLVLFDTRPAARLRPSEWFAALAWLVAFTAALGELFGAGPLYPTEEMTVTGVAMPSALSILATSTGLLLQRPDAGILHIAASAGPGGMLLRRLTVAAIVAPVAANLVISRLLDLIGLEQLPFVYATLAAAATVVGLLLLVGTAISLQRAHQALAASRARARALFQEASDAIFVAEPDGRYIEVNTAACALLGYESDELVGKTILESLVPDERERFSEHRERILDGHSEVDEWTLLRKDGSTVPVEVSARLLPDGRWQAVARDTSERKRAEEELRRALEHVDLALHGADLGSWDWNMSTGELTCNARWAEMRGFRPGEIQPTFEWWRAGVHPDDWPSVERALDAHLEGRAPEYEAEHRCRTRDGGWIWVLDRGRVVTRDASGGPTRMAGTELDITQRRHAEEELRLSEERFSRIVEISADAIVTIDDQQRITMFNDGAEEIFGWRREEILGRPLDVLVPERFRAIHRQHVRSFAAEPTTARRVGDHQRPVVGLRKSGEEFPAESAISKLHVGGTQLFTASLRDVTEPRRREREAQILAELGAALGSTVVLDEIVDRFSSTLARAMADVCITLLSGTESESCRARAVARDPSKLAATRTFEELADRCAHLRRVVQLLATDGAMRVEHVARETLEALLDEADLRAALRRLEPRDMLLVPLRARGETLGIVLLISSPSSGPYRDDDLRFAEELARRLSISIENARLYRASERALRARDEVLGIVAHDLRNPLGIIMLQSGMLCSRADSAATKKAGERIQRSATRMSRLIRDLLDITRLEAGGLELDRDRISTRDVVLESLESQRPLAAAAEIELRVDLASDLPDVWADRDRLLQILENLVGNAVKFTPGGGTIVIGASARDGEVLFRVADTGKGIAAEDVPHLFDRFWQGRQGRRHGAGLGLQIVKGVAEAHGGRVWIDTALGRGSTFFFTIPRADATGHARVSSPVAGA